MLKPGRRELNKIRCRQNILKQARRLFRAKGYESTTIEDIAAAAQISKATLYNYFPSKENLLVGIADTALEEVRQLIRRELKGEPSALQKLRRVLAALALDSIRYLPLTRRMLYLNSFPESGLYGTRQELLKIFTGLVAEAQSLGELRKDRTVEELTEAFLGLYLLTQFGWEHIADYTEEECVDRVNQLVDWALEGLVCPKEE